MPRDIFKILRRMREDIDRFMTDRFEGINERFPEMKGFSYPETDIREIDGKVVIEVDMPGLDKGDIDINAQEEVITIRARKEEETEEERENYYRSERGYKGFYRRLQLPTRIDPEEVGAKYEDGVLTITAEKEEQEEGNKVDVE